jgi:hypothetical protein
MDARPDNATTLEMDCDTGNPDDSGSNVYRAKPLQLSLRFNSRLSANYERHRNATVVQATIQVPDTQRAGDNSGFRPPRSSR